MSVPPVPPPLEQLGHRPFSFYPAILNIEHNEWLYRRATWSEVLVQNTKTNEELWLPRVYLGEISRVDEPVMIVGLMKELEYKAGAVWPAKRRVIEMPRAVNETRRRFVPEPPPGPAPVVGIRIETSHESRLGRILIAGVALGIAGCVLAVSLYRGGIIGSRVFYAPALQGRLGLSAGDDYAVVVRVLGAPSDDRWQSDSVGNRYNLLWYRQRGVYVVLMSPHDSNGRYIGAMDRNWNPIHTVELPGGGNSYSLLRSLRNF
jgi:hypothetical protein